MDIDNKMKFINDFCLTSVAITAIVAISYMAKNALANSDKESTSIIATVDKLLETIVVSDSSKEIKCDIQISDGDAGYYYLKQISKSPIVINKSGFYYFYTSMKNCSGMPNVQTGISNLYNVILINDEIVFAPKKIGLMPQINNERVYLKKGDTVTFATGIQVQTRNWNNTDVKYEELTMDSYNQKQRIKSTVYKDVKFDLCVDIVRE